MKVMTKSINNDYVRSTRVAFHTRAVAFLTCPMPCPYAVRVINADDDALTAQVSGPVH
jgi:hypothetical protein